MIDELISGCFESFGHWILGAVFGIAGVVVLVRAPSSESALVSGLLALVLFHTSTLLIVGFGFGKAKRALAISWVLVLALFLGVAAFLA